MTNEQQAIMKMSPQEYLDNHPSISKSPVDEIEFTVATCTGCGIKSVMGGHDTSGMKVIQCGLCGTSQMHTLTPLKRRIFDTSQKATEPEFKREIFGTWNEEKPLEVPNEVPLESGDREPITSVEDAPLVIMDEASDVDPKVFDEPEKSYDDVKIKTIALNGLVGEWDENLTKIVVGPEFPLWIDPNYIRPSSLKFRRICPNFRQNEQEPELMEAANQGTRIHLAMETGDTDPLEEDDLPLYQWAWECRRKVLTESGLNLDVANPAFISHKELRFEGAARDPETGKHRYEGMVDEVALLPPYGAVMLDYKFGEWKVDSPEFNDQMKDYISKAFKKWKNLRWIRCVIIAPKRGESPEYTFYREELPTINRQISSIRARSHQDITKPNRHCNWCAKVGTCEKLWKSNESLVLDKSELPVANANWNLGKPMDLTKALRARPVVKAMLEAWCNEVKAAGLGLMDEGFEIPGFYQVMRKGKRRIVKMDKMMEKAIELGCSAEEVSDLVKVSMKAITDLVRSKAPRGQKKVVEDQLMDHLAAVDAIAYDDPYPVITQTKE